VPGEGGGPGTHATPAEAIAAYMGCATADLPAALAELAERLLEELAAAARYLCDCCGYRTLLETGHYEICAVCGWEDDRADNTRRLGGPDAPSGPNHISLTEARANFASFGAADQRSRPRVRDPRPEEIP
jgi:Cysteine-rich CPCC